MQAGEWMTPDISVPHRSEHSRGVARVASGTGGDVLPVYELVSEFELETKAVNPIFESR